jgi:putative ABC transport system permease protein
MFKSYVTMAWRSLLKDRTAAIINIGGLALGLATAIIIMLLVVDECSYDKFHSNLKEIYLVMKNQQNADGISTGSATAGPMANLFRTQIPETKYAARVAFFGGQLTSAGDKVVYESGIYADPDLFNMMSFDALQGNPAAALEDPSSVVITAATAKRLFGTDKALGKTMLFNNAAVFKVGAVVKDIPLNSSIRFDMVLPFLFFEQGNDWLRKWDDNRINTWVQLKPGSNLAALNAKLTKILQTRSNDKTVSLFVYPFADKRLFQNFVNGKPSGGRIYMVIMMGTIGLFILLIACINFMNLATARAAQRAREVGVRKVLGASRRSIILHFFSEALLMSLFSLAIALLLARLALPAFNQFTDENLRFDLTSPRLWLLMMGLTVLTGLLAGSYPAVFLSRFKAVKVLKGLVFKGRQGSGLRRALVTFQFIISIFLTISTIVIYEELQHVRNRPIGYDQQNLIDIEAPGELGKHFDIFKHELLQIAAVKAVSAGSDNLLQFGGAVTGMDWPGKAPGQELSVIVSHVQYDWTKTAGLKIMEGRDFDPAFGRDTAGCLINEAAVQKMGLKSPVVGTKVGGSTVIGVVQNFVYNNPSGIIAPMAIYFDKGQLGHIFVRIQNDEHWRQTISRIGEIAKKINPAYPFEFSFTKETYQKRFEEFGSLGLMSGIFGGMAIFISCLGLFGLSVFLAEKRSKEMSIRKVLGASFQQVWLSLSRDFLQPVLIAMLIVTPLAIWAMQAMLSNIPYHIKLHWWIPVAGGLLAMLIALLTVSYQGIRTAFENPSTRLRND